MTVENFVVVTNREQHFRDMGWTVFGNLQNILFQLDFVSEIQIDLETTGLDSFMIEEVNSLQIGIPGTQYIFDIPSISGGLATFKKTIEGKLVIGHNLAFDIPYLYKVGIVPRKVFDTMLTEEVLLLGLPVRHGKDNFKNLADTLRRHLNVKLDKSMQENISEGLVSVEAIEYAGRDVVHLFDLMESQKRRAAAQGLERKVALENKFLPVLCYLEFSGIYVDQEKMLAWIRKVEAQEWLAEEKMKTYADINWRSNEQVGEELKKYGIDVLTEKGNQKTDEEVLKKYDIPIAKDLLELRGLTKKVTTYGRVWAHYIQSDGRIHTKYRQLVETGRTSCGNTDNRGYNPLDVKWRTSKPYPNIQNIPRDSEHRGIFTAKGNNVLISCDYGSQESVILAERSGDTAMIEFFKNGGGDIHSFITRFINKELSHLSLEEIAEKHGDIRSGNKEIVYAFAYGGNAKTAHDNTGVPLERCKEVEEKYFALFSGLKPYYKRCYERAVNLGYMPINSLTNGKRYFDGVEEYKAKYAERTYWNKYWEEKKKNSKWFQEEVVKMRWYHVMTSELKKLAVNTEIQGTAADMSKLGGIYFFDWVVDSGNFGKVLIPCFLHDSYLVEAKEKIKDEVAAKIQWALELAGSKFLKILKINAVPKITKQWTK